MIVNQTNLPNPSSHKPAPTPNHLSNNLLGEHLDRCTGLGTAHVTGSDTFAIGTSVLLGITFQNTKTLQHLYALANCYT